MAEEGTDDSGNVEEMMRRGKKTMFSPSGVDQATPGAPPNLTRRLEEELDHPGLNDSPEGQTSKADVSPQSVLNLDQLMGRLEGVIDKMVHKVVVNKIAGTPYVAQGEDLTPPPKKGVPKAGNLEEGGNDNGTPAEDPGRKAARPEDLEKEKGVEGNVSRKRVLTEEARNMRPINLDEDDKMAEQVPRPEQRGNSYLQVRQSRVDRFEQGNLQERQKRARPREDLEDDATSYRSARSEWTNREMKQKAKEKLEEMEEMARRMKELERKALGGPTRADLGVPFKEFIENEKLPRDFKVQSIALYDGGSDPEDHLFTFRNYAVLHRYSDAIKCRVFATTLTKTALQWFNLLPSRSIGSFEEFSSKFLHQFASSKRHEKTPLSLFSVKQREDETLRAYVKRFNSAALEAPSAMSDLKASAFTTGLKDGDLFKSLTKRPALSFDELLSRAEKYVNLEDAHLIRKAEQQKGKPEDNAKNKPRKEERGNWTPKVHHPVAGHGYREARMKRIPMRGNWSDHLMAVEVKDLIQWPEGADQPPKNPPCDLFCRYHGEYGHDTDACTQLIDEIQRLANMGYLKEYVIRNNNSNSAPARGGGSWRGRGRGGWRGGRGGPGGRGHFPQQINRGQVPAAPKENNNKERATIHIISGGLSLNESRTKIKKQIRSKDARPAYVMNIAKERPAPEIKFGPEDGRHVEMPHTDALIITAVVANYDVQRIFIDSGSSVNVLFYQAYIQMDLGKHELEPVRSPLYGFTGDAIEPLGQIMLPLTLGEGSKKVTKLTRFLIVDSHSPAYNIIIGRPALVLFDIIISIPHMKIKFPVGEEVGEVLGDQHLSQKCYLVSITPKKKTEEKKRKPELMEVEEPEVNKKAISSHVEPVGELMNIELIPGDKEKIVKIGSHLSPDLKEKLIATLRSHADVFSW